MDSRKTPDGLLMDSKWTPDGVHQEAWLSVRPSEKIIGFVLHASLLKHDIMQPQPLLVLINMAPDWLPPLVVPQSLP